MRILFLGDVVGRSGREAVLKNIASLRASTKADSVIVNVENAAAGHGVTVKIAQEFLAAGIDCLTTGNHVWGQKELFGAIDQMPRLLRPDNFPSGTPGKGSCLVPLPDGRKLLVVQLMGRVFIEPPLDNPFAVLDRTLAGFKLGTSVTAIFVDFHAEATSEKMAFAHFFDGRVSAIIGTHTHIPTADEHILPGGTAYQSDSGMCGDYNSVIGVMKEQPIWNFTRQTPGGRFVAAEGEATLCGSLIDIDDTTGKARSICRIQTGGLLTPTPSFADENR
jgi:metallophosphoesterase (TIGR00282 family)